MDEEGGLQGRIIKGIAGFYYVETRTGEVFACKARGRFRRDDIKPLPGDHVTFVITHEGDREGSLIGIHPRRNTLVRPPVANVDQALLFFSIKKPDPSMSLIDRYLISMGRTGLRSVIAFNKSDIAPDPETEILKRTYDGAGADVFVVSAQTGQGLDELLSALSGKITALAGPSGAGKSTLINRLCPHAKAQTGELSIGNDRGKNTTRSSELYRVEGETLDGKETWLVDTPGFSALELPDMEPQELAPLYPEFMKYPGMCRFTSCRHISEPGCAVSEAAKKGDIPISRYESYVQFERELELRIQNRYR